MTNKIVIPYSTFRAAMIMSAKNDVRYYLQGIHFNKEKSRIESTNGSALFTADNVDMSSLSESFILPNDFAKHQLEEGYCQTVRIEKENDTEYRVSFLDPHLVAPSLIVKPLVDNDGKAKYPDVECNITSLEGESISERNFSGSLFAMAGTAFSGVFSKVRFHEEDRIMGATITNNENPNEKILIFGLRD